MGRRGAFADLVRATQNRPMDIGQARRRWAAGTGIAQIDLGALVAGLRAGYAYNTWLLIDSSLVPQGVRLFFHAPFCAIFSKIHRRVIRSSRVRFCDLVARTIPPVQCGKFNQSKYDQSRPLARWRGVPGNGGDRTSGARYPDFAGRRAPASRADAPSKRYGDINSHGHSRCARDAAICAAYAAASA